MILKQDSLPFLLLVCMCVTAIARMSVSCLLASLALAKGLSSKAEAMPSCLGLSRKLPAKRLQSTGEMLKELD